VLLFVVSYTYCFCTLLEKETTNKKYTLAVMPVKKNSRSNSLLGWQIIYDLMKGLHRDSHSNLFYYDFEVWVQTFLV
jgi:hypothetical protein